MENETKLTLRQRKFLKYYLETGNASQSALSAGYKEGGYAYEILENPIFKAAYQQLMDKKGLSDDVLLEKHKQLLESKKLQTCDIYIKDENGKLVINKNSNDFIEVEDNQAQLGALKLAYQVKERLTNNDGNGDKPGQYYITNILLLLRKAYEKRKTPDGRREVIDITPEVSS